MTNILKLTSGCGGGTTFCAQALAGSLDEYLYISNEETESGIAKRMFEKGLVKRNDASNDKKFLSHCFNAEECYKLLLRTDLPKTIILDINYNSRMTKSKGVTWDDVINYITSKEVPHLVITETEIKNI